MSYYNQLLTVLENSDLSQEDKDYIINAFSCMSYGDQATFVSLAQEGSIKLSIAANFLKEVPQQEDISEEKIKDYLNAIS